MLIPFFIHHASDHWPYNHKVAFDGENKLILVNKEVVALDMTIDLYSDWKEWVGLRDHTKFLEAIETEGGNPTPTGFVGRSFFLVNGWRMRTWEGDHVLTLNGNIYVADTNDGGGPNLFVPTIDPHNILIQQAFSNLTDLVIVSGSSGTSSSGSFTEADRTLLTTVNSIVANLPNSGSLTDLTSDIGTLVSGTVLRSGTVIGGTTEYVTTTIGDLQDV